MRNTEEILKELKAVQDEITKAETAKNIDCKKYLFSYHLLQKS